MPLLWWMWLSRLVRAAPAAVRAPVAWQHNGVYIHRRRLPQLPAQAAADRILLDSAPVVMRATPDALRDEAVAFLNERFRRNTRLTLPLADLARHLRMRTGFVLRNRTLRALTGDPLCDVAFWLDSLPGVTRRGNMVFYQNPAAPTREEVAYAREDALFRRHLSVHRPERQRRDAPTPPAREKHWMLAGSAAFRPKKKSKRNTRKAR